MKSVHLLRTRVGYFPIARNMTTLAGESTARRRQKEERRVTATLSNATLEFRTGHMARFAGGSAVLAQDDNSILGTVVMRERDSNGSASSGLALAVDFKQSAAAIGRIPTNFLRKELGQTDQDIIASRIIDRTLRPAFFPNFPHTTHVVCKPLALDAELGDAIVMGVNVAAAALAISPVPTWCIPAAVRIGIINGKIMINPPREQMKHSSMDMVMGGSNEGRLLMIEMDGKEVDTDTLLETIRLGSVEIAKIVAAIQALSNGVEKKSPGEGETPLPMELFEGYGERLSTVFSFVGHDKTSRDEAIRQVRDEWAKENPDTPLGLFNDFVRHKLREWTMLEGRRCDGRGYEEIRPISMEVDVYRRLHGSALFQRGQSQVFSNVTFDSPQAAFHPDGIAQLLGTQRRKTFMLHYEFPNFAINEVGGGGGSSSRREVGHGMLAEKALKHLIPENFPYTIRLSCQVLESNGSTSMASVCAGSLALMDAGVPITNPAAGIAIGMFSSSGEGSEAPKNYTLLTDLLGMEDYFGDMDFKLAGTKDGFTALQLDLKSTHLTEEQLREIFGRGRQGLDYVLAKMASVLAEARSEFKESVPIMEELTMPHYKKAVLFRSGAYNAKLIAAEVPGVQISSDEEDKITILAPNREKMEAAKRLIDMMLADNSEENFTFAQFYKAEIVDVVENGVMLLLKKGAKPIFMRNGDLSPRKVGHASALGLKVGQHLIVQYFGRDQATGFHRITRRTITSNELAVEN